jgi:hypothetical protein
MVDSRDLARTVTAMSGNSEATEAKGEEPARALSVDAQSDSASEEKVDQLGIPMSREPTIDDVRSDGEAHRRMALGCTLLVVAGVASFWVFRVWLAG